MAGRETKARVGEYSIKKKKKKACTTEITGENKWFKKKTAVNDSKNEILQQSNADCLTKQNPPEMLLR